MQILLVDQRIAVEVNGAIFDHLKHGLGDDARLVPLRAFPNLEVLRRAKIDELRLP